MVLYEVVPRHLVYYQITFRHIPEEYILGGACIACGHTGPVNRYQVEGRWSRDAQLRMVDDRLRCLACDNRDHNTFIVYGRRVRKVEQRPMPATVEFGAPAGSANGLAQFFEGVSTLFDPPANDAAPAANSGTGSREP